jgi:hypothetical protein
MAGRGRIHGGGRDDGKDGQDNGKHLGGQRRLLAAVRIIR